MCLARVILKDGTQEEIVLKNVTSFKVDGDNISVETLMDESRDFKGVLESVDFNSSSITIRAAV